MIRNKDILVIVYFMVNIQLLVDNNYIHCIKYTILGQNI